VADVTLGTDCLHDLERALGLEWLEANGLGGFACSTVVGCNTRRYHGLLVSAPNGPGSRVVLLSKLEDRIEIGDDKHELSCNLYGDVLHPRGYAYLTSFSSEPWPTWTFDVEGWRLRKEIALLHSRNILVVRYTLTQAPHPVWLISRPLFAGRDYHHLRRASSDVPTRLAVTERALDLEIAGPGTRCVLRFPGGEALTDGLWYYNFRYPVEAERGLDSGEDLYSPGQVRWLLGPGDSAVLVASDGAEEVSAADELEGEADRRAWLVAGYPEHDQTGRRLLRAADQFAARRPFQDRCRATIVAGYPWFTDWGRDTMVSLPGLLISRGRLDEAAEVFELFTGSLRNGLVPNRFADDGSGASYNSVDATLWLFVAARLYARAAGPDLVAGRLYPALADSLRRLILGTDFGIRADEDGLLLAGDATTQLTWMDAKVGDRPVTPRWHKPVEVEALWVSALRTMEYLAGTLGAAAAAREHGSAARRARQSFEKTFWDPARGYLADCLTPEGPDGTLRPNQVLALSLPYKVVGDDVAASVLAAVEQHLLTPYGLRTLAPGSPGYCPIYAGGPAQRDAAYHQGTVWPWLLGPYLRAKMSLMPRGEETRRWARELLGPLLGQLDRGCLGQVGEIFDAEPPHTPRGCFAQAWSVAEILRVWMDYRLGELD